MAKATRACAALILGTGAAAMPALAAQGPPPLPKAASGAKVSVLAQGVPTPTAIAFSPAGTFAAAGGSENKPKVPGGVFLLKAGKAMRLPGSPPFVAGLAVRGGTLYVTAGSRVLAWRGWNGTRFTSAKVVYTAPRGFTGFNGLAFGPDGRIYTGVSLGDNKRDDFTAATTPFGNSLISLRPDGTDVTVVAKGLRQPWQVAFAGARGPFVSDLGQENLGRKQPPDYVVLAKPGQDYGFPTCNWSKAAACASYPKPFALLPAHSSPMGLGALGGRLYVALFNGRKGKPEVVSLPLSGGAPKPVLTGFVAPIVALTTHGGRLYVGDLTGAIYSVRAS
jgi:glucose/arabinose dehydrogenase